MTVNANYKTKECYLLNAYKTLTRSSDPVNPETTFSLYSIHENPLWLPSEEVIGKRAIRTAKLIKEIINSKLFSNIYKLNLLNLPINSEVLKELLKANFCNIKILTIENHAIDVLLSETFTSLRTLELRGKESIDLVKLSSLLPKKHIKRIDSRSKTTNNPAALCEIISHSTLKSIKLLSWSFNTEDSKNIARALNENKLITNFKLEHFSKEFLHEFLNLFPSNTNLQSLDISFISKNEDSTSDSFQLLSEKVREKTTLFKLTIADRFYGDHLLESFLNLFQRI